MVDPLAAVTAVDPVAPGASGPAIEAPEPALPDPLRDAHRDGLELAGNLVMVAAMGAIVAGLAATATVAARRRRADSSG
jgi:hypothetical protein